MTPKGPQGSFPKCYDFQMTRVATEAFRPINLREYQRPGEKSWDLPPWNHPVSQGVYLLSVIKDEHVFPIGTAFLISRIGIVATAYHNITDAMRFHRNGERLRIGGLRNNYHVNDMQLCVLHHVLLADGASEFSLIPIKGVHGGPPSDVIYGVLAHDPHVLRRPFTLSPGVPRINSTVLSVGYCEMQYPDDGIPLESIRSGTFDWISDYSHRLCVREGRVEAVFTNSFAPSYVGGPCFLIDCEIEQGLSGGPVFNESTYACGINSAGMTTIMGRPTSLVSMIYPTLPVEISLQEGLRSLESLIRTGKVISDGTIDLCRVHRDENGIRVDPLVHQDDRHAIFETGAHYENNSSALPITDRL